MTEQQKGPLFVFKSDPGEIAWPCTISVPLSGGERQDQIVTARFVVVSNERLDELVGTALSRLTPVEGASPQGDLPLLQEVLKGFNDLKNESGQSVGDETAKSALLALPYAVRGLARGYVEMIGLRPAKN